jgi:hypothetical protein
MVWAEEWSVLMGMKRLPLNWHFTPRNEEVRRGKGHRMRCGARDSAPMAREAGATLEAGGGGSLLRCGRRKKGRLGQMGRKAG